MFISLLKLSVSSSFRAAAKKRKQEGSYPLGDGGVFGALVRSVSEKGEWRECATCHRLTPMKKMLLNSPDVGEWNSDRNSTCTVHNNYTHVQRCMYMYMCT